MSKIKPIIEQSFEQYSAAVIQSRALVDARDGLKPSARQIFYSMLQHKLVHKNPYKKTANAVGMAMADYYIHGDSSCEGIIMRAGQGFAMRYPLVDVKGNAGSLIESGNWAAMRYTESRLSELSSVLFDDIDKDTINEWRDNYDNTKQFPAVLPSKGFYNLCNGTSGIAIGLASSIPQFNVREVNKALTYLIDHPDCSFDEIYCAPDFATGAVLYNEEEVKQSLKNGTGFACKLRSIVDFDSGERCFVVKEIPYGVYTNTICGELEKIIESEENPGIERFNDLTGKTPLIKIYIAKKASPDKVLRYLYKETSLQHYYGINLTMLDNGHFPKVFTWKEALQAHIEHEKQVYRNGFLFDLNKIESRIHIIDGLLICLASIDEVVQTIKSSNSTQEAAKALKTKYLLDDDQAKAVLDMKLSRLAHLEVKKLENEREELKAEATRIHSILDSEELFNNELKKGWTAVANKYGDARRTKIINIGKEGEEPVEVKQLQVSLTNKNNLYVVETSSLYTQRRGGVGNKFKADQGEYVIDSKTLDSNDQLLLFTVSGNVYHVPVSSLPLTQVTSAFNYIPIKEWENICAMSSNNKKDANQYIYFLTKQGMIKKSLFSEYNINRNVGLRALNLNEGDEIISVIFGNDPTLGLMTEMGNFLMIKTDDVRPVGRVALGVRAIKLNEGDHLVAAHAISEDATYLASISGAGLFKKTSISEFAPQGKNTKGSKIQKLTEGDWMADFIPINREGDLLIVSTRSCIKLTTNDLPLLGKGAQGNKSIKLGASDNVVHITYN